jgi:hypothetical protein
MNPISNKKAKHNASLNVPESRLELPSAAADMNPTSNKKAKHNASL